jgi:hypothetical protein
MVGHPRKARKLDALRHRVKVNRPVFGALSSFFIRLCVACGNLMKWPFNDDKSVAFQSDERPGWIT